MNSFDCVRGSPSMGDREMSPQPKLARRRRSGRESRRVVIFDREKNLYGKLEAKSLHSAKCLILRRGRCNQRRTGAIDVTV